MDPGQVISALRRSWWVVALCALLGLGGAFAYNQISPVSYQAHVQQFVSFADQGSDSSNALSGAQFTLQRVKSYAQVATSSEVLEPVIRDLRLPDTGAGLANRLEVTNPLDTVLIDIAVTDMDPEQAATTANAIAAQFTRVVQSIERPAADGSSPVKVTLTEAAKPPATPIAPRVNLNLALGLLVGLALGVGAALLRARLDTTVKSPAEVEAITGAVPLGLVPFDPKTRQQPLGTNDRSSPRAEAFRALRTNLQFVDVDTPPRSIVVTSAMPGEGKSTAAANIAVTLAVNGARVVLIEADLRKPQVCDYLGLDSAAGLTNVLAGQVELSDVLVGWNRDQLTVLPSGPPPPNPSELLHSQQMVGLLRRLETDFEYVIIDSAPLLPVTDAAVLAAVADGAIMVMRHGRTTIEEATRAVHALSVVKARMLGTLMNCVPRRGRGYGGYASYYGSYDTQAASGRGGKKGPPKVGSKGTAKGGAKQERQRAKVAASAPDSFADLRPLEYAVPSVRPIVPRDSGPQRVLDLGAAPVAVQTLPAPEPASAPAPALLPAGPATKGPGPDTAWNLRAIPKPAERDSARRRHRRT